MTNYLTNEKDDVGKKPKNLEEFYQYITRKYGAKGRRAIRFSSRSDELDTLLGVKYASKFDEEDMSYLDDEQLRELEKLIKKEEDFGIFKNEYGKVGHY